MAVCPNKRLPPTVSVGACYVGGSLVIVGDTAQWVAVLIRSGR